MQKNIYLLTTKNSATIFGTFTSKKRAEQFAAQLFLKDYEIVIMGINPSM